MQLRRPEGAFKGVVGAVVANRQRASVPACQRASVGSASVGSNRWFTRQVLLAFLRNVGLLLCQAGALLLPLLLL
jgi:hypothetical protein